jgi:hypothetical protein
MTPPHKKVRPRELKTPLLNPHKGCATFQRFNGDPLYPTLRSSHAGPTEFPARQYDVAPGYLPTTLACCKWFWETLEPDEGRFDWSMVDGALRTADERGQTLLVHLMPHGSWREPKVPGWYRAKYRTVEKVTHQGQSPCNVPLYDSPEFLDHWGRVITEFGRRFDGDPRLESMDMSFIGPWGEGAGECSEEAIDRMAGIYRKAHRKTPLVAMIAGYKMKAGIRAGMGWRCACFGDLGIFENPHLDKALWWNHHFDCYPQEVVASGATDAWKHAPVHFETCGVPMDYFNKGFDLDLIFQQGLKFHGSVLMPKSTALPEPWMDRLAQFCNDLGYRFVLRQFKFDSRAKQGTSFDWWAWVENVGVAPIYRRYTLAVRLTQGNRTHIHHSPVDIRAWLPGDACLHENVRLPAEFQPGSVMLHAAFVDAATNATKVRFAVEGADGDGWVPLDTIEIT